jgi:hypothetical protein
VELVVCWWEIEELVEDDGDAVENDANVVRPPPASGSVSDKGASDDGSKD